MRIPYHVLVVVTDGRRMLFLRNEGDADYPDLRLETAREQDNPPAHEQGTDAPGRSFSSVGHGRSAYSNADFHEIAEDRFAVETAELLKEKALAGTFREMILVAPPRVLGDLRPHLHREVVRRIIGELDRDLTGEPVWEIEKALQKAD